jgi:hypothetical protein
VTVEPFIVAREPALLGGMAYPPRDTDWASLYELGFRRVVRLHAGEYDPAPLVASAFELEDLHGGLTPSHPESERARVLEAARAAARWVADGEGVLVHCAGGTGRTGTVLVCALRYLGRPLDEAIRAVQAHRPAWPESAWQEAVARELW